MGIDNHNGMRDEIMAAEPIYEWNSLVNITEAPLMHNGPLI